MFIDEVYIDVIAGNGGNGCMAFRREKYIEMGGPYGGNGGKGADIIFKADEGLNTLIDLKYKKLIKGDKGENGLGKGQMGKSADDTIIRVPVGTVVTDTETNEIIADLTENNEEAIVALGGRGGRGNIALATRTNSCPSYAENGEEGERKHLKVELKLLADVGLVGMPSVGKSTIISVISAAKPKIAAYHFTTLSPNLGVVKTKNNSFVVADLPGLIEGASKGEGLGDQFLKHISRTRVIAQVVDISGYEGRDPYDDFVKINKELEEYDKSLLDRPMIVIANKIDIDFNNNLEEFSKKVKLPIFPVSASSNKGLDKVVDALGDMLAKLPKEQINKEEKLEGHILYKFKKEEPFKIEKIGEHKFRIKGEKVERILKMTKFQTEESVLRFENKLRHLGIDDALMKMGCEEGDTIYILDYEFDFKI